MDLLLALIAQIYDAALDPALWEIVLQKIAAFCEASRVVLVVEDAEDPGQSLFYASFHDPEWIAMYFQSFMLINPMRLATVANVRAGDVLLTSDFLSEQEYRRTSFARDFLGSRDMVDVTTAVLDKTSTRVTILSALRSTDQGFADHAVRRKLQMLVPHAQRAVHIGHLLEQKTLKASSLADTLDALHSAIVLVDAAGTILHANLRATELFEKEAVARKARGQLVLHGGDAAATLALALRAAAAGDTPTAAGIAIPLRADGEQKLVATVIPLRTAARKPARPEHGAVAAVCIQEVAFDIATAKHTVGPLYGLTRRELTILFAIIEVGGVPTVAATLGLAETTVQTHLKSIYRKTGASRHADLVKLVVGATGRLATPPPGPTPAG